MCATTRVHAACCVRDLARSRPFRPLHALPGKGPGRSEQAQGHSTIGGGPPPMAVPQTTSAPLTVAPHFSSGLLALLSSATSHFSSGLIALLSSATSHCLFCRRPRPKADAPLLVGIAAVLSGRCPPIGGHRRCLLADAPLLVGIAAVSCMHTVAEQLPRAVAHGRMG